MSYRDRGQKQSAFWDRLRENARSIVEQDHADLKKQICEPAHCLLEKDKEMMRSRQRLLEQYNQDIERLKQDSFRSRVLAMGTVLFAGPKR